MGVLTKPDLNIERATQQIAIDHVSGKRRDLTLGYYIVKNRGPDDANMTLEEGQKEELKFFVQEPWSSLRSTGRTGIEALKSRARELLMDLVKREFPQLRLDIVKVLGDMRKQRETLGLARDTSNAQRAYLGTVCDKFQTAVRDALDANYANDDLFRDREDLRLITRVVDAHESFSTTMWKSGHTRPFAEGNPADLYDFSPLLTLKGVGSKYLELQDIIDYRCATYQREEPVGGSIMQYIKEIYNQSRGEDLGTVSNRAL